MGQAVEGGIVNVEGRKRGFVQRRLRDKETAGPRCGDLFVVPLLADSNRVMPDGALKVWRTRDQGRPWRAMTSGLPQKEHFVGVLRDAMTADPLTPAGVYLGTTGGEVFYSKDDGDTWEKLPAQFPRITTLKTWLV